MLDKKDLTPMGNGIPDCLKPDLLSYTLSKDCYPVKPADGGYGAMALLPAEGTLEDLCGHISSGRAVCASVLRHYPAQGGHRLDNFHSQRLLPLDLDNKNVPIMEKEGIIERLRPLGVNIIHETYSSGPECRKYHAYWTLENTVTDPGEIRKVYAVLIKILTIRGFKGITAKVDPVTKKRTEESGHIDISKKNVCILMCGCPESVIFFDDKPRITLDSLLNILMDEMKKSDFSHYTRNLKAFLKKNEIIVDDISDSSIQCKSGENLPYYILSISMAKTHQKYRPVKLKTLIHTDHDACAAECALIRYFESGYVGHNETLGLAMGYYSKIRGGKKLFMDTLSKNRREIIQNSSKPDPILDRQSIYKNAAAYDNSMNCQKFCPHHVENGGDCDKSFILQGKNLHRASYFRLFGKNNENKPRNIENIRDDIEAAGLEIINNPDNKIHAFKSGTGTGKSTLFLRMFNKSIQPVCMAFSTHSLKEEKVNDFYRICGEPARHPHVTIKQPALPGKYGEQMALLEGMGIYDAVADVYRAFLRDYPEDNGDKAEYCRQYEAYLESVRGLHRQQFVFTTHERIFVSPLAPGIKTVVIDEDGTSALIKRVSVSKNDIVNLLALAKDSETKELAKTAAECIASGGAIRPRGRWKLDRERFRGLIVENIEMFDSQIIKLPDCDILGAVGDGLVGYQLNRLSENRTYIILSATPQLGILRRLYGDRVVVHEFGETPRRARIRQHLKKSYSRAQFQSDPELLNRVAERIAAGGYDSVISYKFVEDRLKGALPGVKWVHYGDATGTNKLRDCKKCLMVGTPHPNVGAVGMLHSLVGGTETETGGMVKTITANGCAEFSFPLPENRETHELYKSLIEFEMVQAVGRLRPAENDCEVDIFANYPLEGCEYDLREVI